MTNYEAIMRMDPEEMEAFLDAVYLTGVNNALYALQSDDPRAEEICDEFPYAKDWLSASAEPGTAAVFDGDQQNLPNALADAIFRMAGLDPGVFHTDAE